MEIHQQRKISDETTHMGENRSFLNYNESDPQLVKQLLMSEHNYIKQQFASIIQ